MSDSGAEVGRDEIWIEKYRPHSLDDVLGHPDITDRIQSYIERDDLPHLLFAGPAGVGKTSISLTIAKTLYGDEWRENFLELNASDERGIDVVRDRIKNFARSSFGGYDYRIIFLDEADSLCVPAGTEVLTGHPALPEVKPIEEVDTTGEPIPSVNFDTNQIQADTGKRVDSGLADFFEVELADGREIVASHNHPFFVVDPDGQLIERELKDLRPGDEIADFKEDVGLSRCECCGKWTPGRFCSMDCRTGEHSPDSPGDGNPTSGTVWSEEGREAIVQNRSNGGFEGETDPSLGGDFHGVHVTMMGEEPIDKGRKASSEMRSGIPGKGWTVDADPETVKQQIEKSSAEWWWDLDEEAKEMIHANAVRDIDESTCSSSGDTHPTRDPAVAAKDTTAQMGHDPTGPMVRDDDELGHYIRSEWEHGVAKALSEAEIEYEYEPRFELSNAVSDPDVLVGDTVIEVEGRATLRRRPTQATEFLAQYGDEYAFLGVGGRIIPENDPIEMDDGVPSVVSDGGRASVSTARVRHIGYSHRGKAYNISMEGTPNFMLANGILTHNTSDAQSALRRTMEQFSNNTRFILSCNYSSQIIDPIQSRCAVFRFSPIPDEAVAEQIRKIAAAEDIEITDGGVDALVYQANGDMRKAINGLQAAAILDETVDEEAVYTITSTARPEEIEAMVTSALEGDFTAARSVLDELLTDKGLAGGDIIDQLHRSIWEFDLDDEEAVRLLDRIGEADYRIAEGANERVQLEALLAAVALKARD